MENAEKLMCTKQHVQPFLPVQGVFPRVHELYLGIYVCIVYRCYVWGMCISFYLSALMSWMSGYTQICAKMYFFYYLPISEGLLWHSAGATVLFVLQTSYFSLSALQLRFTLYLCVCLLLILYCMSVLYLEFVLQILIALLQYFLNKENFQEVFAVLHERIFFLLPRIHTVRTVANDCLPYQLMWRVFSQSVNSLIVICSSRSWVSFIKIIFKSLPDLITFIYIPSQWELIFSCWCVFSYFSIVSNWWKYKWTMLGV